MPQPPRRRAFGTVVALAVAGALAGCGGSADRGDSAQPAPVAAPDRGVLALIDQLQASARAGDARRICDDLFTDGLARSVSGAAGRSCAAEVRRSLVSPQAQFAVSSDIRVSGGEGRATLREENGSLSDVYVVRDGDRWRIDRVQPHA